MFFVFETTIELMIVLFAKRIVDLNSKTTMAIDRGWQHEYNFSSNRALVRIETTKVTAFEREEINESPQNDTNNRNNKVIQFGELHGDMKIWKENKQR